MTVQILAFSLRLIRILNPSHFLSRDLGIFCLPAHSFPTRKITFFTAFFQKRVYFFFAKCFRKRPSKWHLVVLTLDKTCQTEFLHLMGWCSLLKSNPSSQHLHQSLILYIEVAQGFYLPGWNVQFTYTCTLTSHFTSLSSVMLLAYISTYFLLSKWTVTLFFKNFSSVLTCHSFRLLHAYILCHHLLVSAVSLLSCPLKRFLFCTFPLWALV